ncbi:MAG: hypothetical protein AAB316_12270 [Bacteroidota bacterium]
MKAKRRKPTPRKPGDNEGNKFDKIVKENLRALTPALLDKVLKIHTARMENPPEVRVQTTEEIEPDFVKIIFNDEYPEGCLLCVEFEAKDEIGTDDTMLHYVAAQRKKYRLPVDLRMVWLLPGEPKNITGEDSFCGLKFTYPVYLLHEISFREFLFSDKPEEVVWSILCNPDGVNREEIIRLILERLVKLRGKSRSLNKFIKQLKIMSMLRNLRAETVKQIRNMTVTPDIVRQIKESEEYQLGIEDGKQEGREEGREEGELLKAIAAIRKMSQKNFDPVVIADLLEVSEKFVLDTQAQLKKEPQIIAHLAKPRATVQSVAKKLSVSHLLVQVIKDASI